MDLLGSGWGSRRSCILDNEQFKEKWASRLSLDYLRRLCDQAAFANLVSNVCDLDGHGKLIVMASVTPSHIKLNHCFLVGTLRIDASSHEPDGPGLPSYRVVTRIEK